jgi:tetraacyldisaccharide 4'-kinase
MFYALGIKKQEAPHITTIGVGNLSTGGSGKTPHVEYLLRLLADKYPTAMLSRGYKRKSKGFILDDGSHDATLLGDEPAMLARKFPHVQVAVCEKRVEGVKRLMTMPDPSDDSDESNKKNTPQLIILDDVFQHRAIKPSINILLTEYHHPYFDDHILPYGDLREFKSARFRAGIVIVTKCPEKLNPMEKHNILHDLRLKNYQQIFFSYFKYGDLQTLDGHTVQTDLRRMDNILAVTGIAHPEPMLAELRRYTRVQHLSFADHHDFTSRDIEHIRDAFAALPGANKTIITTEKDAMRLRGLVDGLPIHVLPITVAFHKENDKDFDKLIDSSVRENISFLGKLSIWS